MGKIRIGEWTSIFVRITEHFELLDFELASLDCSCFSVTNFIFSFVFQQVHSKIKPHRTNNLALTRTPLSDIFRGQMRSRVQKVGDSATNNIEPFFTLHLNIEVRFRDDVSVYFNSRLIEMSNVCSKIYRKRARSKTPWNCWLAEMPWRELPRREPIKK